MGVREPSVTLASSPERGLSSGSFGVSSPNSAAQPEVRARETIAKAAIARFRRMAMVLRFRRYTSQNIRDENETGQKQIWRRLRDKGVARRMPSHILAKSH